MEEQRALAPKGKGGISLYDVTDPATCKAIDICIETGADCCSIKSCKKGGGVEYAIIILVVRRLRGTSEMVVTSPLGTNRALGTCESLDLGDFCLDSDVTARRGGGKGNDVLTGGCGDDGL